MSNEVGKIYQAMANIMLEVGAIGKNQTNSHQRYQFRGIDDMYNHLQLVMSKNGVSSIPTNIIDLTREQVKTSGGKPTNSVSAVIEYTFYASDGSSIKCQSICEALDNSDKASSKAMSMAHKYALIQAFCIPVEDIAEADRDSLIIDNQQSSDSIEFINSEQSDSLEKMITDYGVNRTAFISWLTKQKIAKSIVKIPSKHYEIAFNALEAKKPKGN